MPGRILILFVLVRAVPGIGLLSIQPAFVPRVAEYVWFDDDNSGYLWDKDEDVREVMNIPYILPTAVESMPEEVITKGENQNKMKPPKYRIRLG